MQAYAQMSPQDDKIIVRTPILFNMKERIGYRPEHDINISITYEARLLSTISFTAPCRPVLIAMTAPSPRATTPFKFAKMLFLGQRDVKALFLAPLH